MASSSSLFIGIDESTKSKTVRGERGERERERLIKNSNEFICISRDVVAGSKKVSVGQAAECAHVG
jgi:hypothetical protein